MLHQLSGVFLGKGGPLIPSLACLKACNAKQGRRLLSTRPVSRSDGKLRTRPEMDARSLAYTPPPGPPLGRVPDAPIRRPAPPVPHPGPFLFRY